MHYFVPRVQAAVSMQMNILILGSPSVVSLEIHLFGSTPLEKRGSNHCSTHKIKNRCGPCCYSHIEPWLLLLASPKSAMLSYLRIYMW